MRFMNSGVNRRRAASTPACDELLGQVRVRLAASESPSFGRISEFISAAPRLLVMKMMAREKSTRRLSPSVSVALSRIPSSRFHSASLAFSISSNSTKLSFSDLGVELVEPFLAELRMRLAMAQVSGRRADQFGDLVTVLELGAVDLHHRLRIARQALRHRLDGARLARPVGPRNSRLPTGRPGVVIPARNVW